MSLLFHLQNHRGKVLRPSLVIAIASWTGPTHLIFGRVQEDPMTESAKPRLVGFNHVALEVGDIEEALAFYGRLFAFELRGGNDSHGLHRSGRQVHSHAGGT